MSEALPSVSQVFRTVPCFCGRMLYAARALSRLYNEELRRAGMEATQFGILQMVARLGPMTQNQLGDRLAAGKTTVSRNLKLLKKRGWVDLAAGEDRRCRMVSLTDAGRRQTKKAQPYWERAQQRLRAAMPEAQLKALHDLLPFAAEAALRA